MTKRRKKRPAGALAGLAKTLGITPRHCSTLLAAGMPEDPAGARRWRSERLGTTDAESSAETLRRERILLVREQREKVALENQVRRAELMPRADWQQSDTRIGFAMRAAILRLETNLPGMLAGLSEVQIATVLQRELYQVLEDLADEQSEFWTKNPTTELSPA